MPRTIVTISDFNLDNFNALLTHLAEPPALEVIETPFGQVSRLLTDSSAACWQRSPDCAFVWTLPGAVVSSFARAVSGHAVAHDEVLAEVDQFASLLRHVADRAGAVLVPSWIPRSDSRGYGLLNMQPQLGLTNLLLRMNLRLADRLTDAANVFVLDASPWIQRAGPRAFHPKYWYASKTPFGNEVFKQAAAEIKSAVSAIFGQNKKIILLDLDDTLWGGIVGDVGVENLCLGGHDPVGEAFVDFQRALLARKSRGILLGLISKNDPSVALAAIDKHPEMILRKSDFAGWRINWRDKAANIVELMEELNLGLDSAVFIDDNPIERARVREALPDVTVIDWPTDKRLYRATLEQLSCFDSPHITEEDRNRTHTYQRRRDRVAARAAVASPEAWLATLDTDVTVTPLNEIDLPRATQLLNKTNQMNLATRRMPQSQYWQWSRAGGRKVWTFRVSDRFGDHGLTGLVAVEADQHELAVLDFVLSCRVFGRGIEQVMLATVLQHARQIGCDKILARFFATEKNNPCLEFFRSSPLVFHPQTSEFYAGSDVHVDVPAYLRVISESPVSVK